METDGDNVEHSESIVKIKQMKAKAKSIYKSQASSVSAQSGG